MVKGTAGLQPNPQPVDGFTRDREIAYMFVRAGDEVGWRGDNTGDRRISDKAARVAPRDHFFGALAPS